jgi:hypothetical protein
MLAEAARTPPASWPFSWSCALVPLAKRIPESQYRQTVLPILSCHFHGHARSISPPGISSTPARRIRPRRQLSLTPGGSTPERSLAHRPHACASGQSRGSRRELPSYQTHGQELRLTRVETTCGFGPARGRARWRGRGVDLNAERSTGARFQLASIDGLSVLGQQGHNVWVALVVGKC